MIDNEQPTSKKWVDYSDESDGEDDHTKVSIKSIPSESKTISTKVIDDHKSKEFSTYGVDIVEAQLARVVKRKERFPDVWLLLQSTDVYLLKKRTNQFKDELHDQGNPQLMGIFRCREQQDAFDLQVHWELANKFLEEGLDRERLIKITVSERNFTSRGGGERGRGRGGRGRGEGRGRGGDRGGGDRRRRDGDGGNEKKAVYVDKQTGTKANNKQQIEQKLLEDKQRLYTRQEAEQKGMELGSFRNKPLVVKTPEDEERERREIERIEREAHREKHTKYDKPVQSKPWSRKEFAKVEETDIQPKPEERKVNKLNDIDKDIKSREQKKKEEETEEGRAEKRKEDSWKKREEEKKLTYLPKVDSGEGAEKKAKYSEKNVGAKKYEPKNKEENVPPPPVEDRQKNDLLSEDSD